MAKPNAISRVCAAPVDAATVPISGRQKTPATPANAGNGDHVEPRSTPAHHHNHRVENVVRRSVPVADGSELARRIFTSQAWSLQPGVRPHMMALIWFVTDLRGGKEHEMEAEHSVGALGKPAGMLIGTRVVGPQTAP